MKKNMLSLLALLTLLVGSNQLQADWKDTAKEWAKTAAVPVIGSGIGGFFGYINTSEYEHFYHDSLRDNMRDGLTIGFIVGSIAAALAKTSPIKKVINRLNSGSNAWLAYPAACAIIFGSQSAIENGLGKKALRETTHVTIMGAVLGLIHKGIEIYTTPADTTTEQEK